MSNFNSQVFCDGENKDLFNLSAILIATVKNVLAKKGSIYLSQDPMIREKPIVEFARRMRVDGLEKFAKRTVVAVVNFYLDQEHIDKEQSSGALLAYIPADYLNHLMKMLDYDSIDEDSDEELCDACGTVVNLIAGNFIQDVAANGFVQLQMASFQSFINTPLDGIGFNSKEVVKHEVEFFIGGEKKMVFELTMSPFKRYRP